MKKLFLAISIVLSVSAIGQIHKATGDKPYGSIEFNNYGSDSSLFATTAYTYNSNNQVVKQITRYKTQITDKVDSIVKNYDAKNRIVSVFSFEDNDLSSSNIWKYDEPNRQIDYYELRGSLGYLDTVYHIRYEGVRNFDDVDEHFSALLTSFFEVNIEIRECDAMHVYYDEDGNSSWKPVTNIYPKYKSGKPTSVKIEIDEEFFAKFLEEFEKELEGITISDIVLTLTPTYNGNKLTKIKGDLSMMTDVVPFPVLATDFIVLTNQYNGDFLTETKTELSLNVVVMGAPVFAEYMGGDRKLYNYNWDKNVSCIAAEYTTDGTSWDLDSKIYYQYHIDYQDDIELVSLIFDGNANQTGEMVNIKVIVRNKHANPVQNINITAKIFDFQNNELATIHAVIPSINTYSEIPYIFANAYAVPAIPYGICVYIDNIDTIPENDTICESITITSIKEINGMNLFVSQNIPNPASDVALFKYSIPTNGKVQFTIHSISGQILYVHTEDAKLGENSLELSVSHLASGIYFYSMEFNGQRIVKKMSVKK